MPRMWHKDFWIGVTKTKVSKFVVDYVNCKLVACQAIYIFMDYNDCCGGLYILFCDDVLIYLFI